MSFKLTSEQQEFQDSLRSFLSENVTSEYLRKRIESKTSSDPNLWGKLSRDLGLHAYFATDDESMKPGFVELSIIAHECGYSLLPEPLLESLIAGPYLLTSIVPRSTREALAAIVDIEKILSGEARVAYAPLLSDASTVSLAAGGSSVEADLRMVSGAEGSSHVLFAVGDSIYMSPLANAAITRESSLDETQKLYRVALSAECSRIEGVQARLLRSIVDGAKACEAAGATKRAVEMTTEHVKTRKQFGVPIGGFQAVQHTIAEMYLASESLASLSRFAAWSVDHSPTQRDLATSAAISLACDSGPEIVENAIQMHGGIGFTWEYDLHFFLRRVRAIAALNARTAKDYSEILELAGKGGA